MGLSTGDSTWGLLFPFKHCLEREHQGWLKHTCQQINPMPPDKIKTLEGQLKLGQAHMGWQVRDRE